MLPDYLIYDELKRRRESEELEQRPQLEVPRYMPMLPEDGYKSDDSRDIDGESTDVLIIKM